MLTKLFEAISSSDPFNALCESIKNNAGFTLELNSGPACALFLTALHQRKNKSIAVICDENGAAASIYGDCLGMLPESVFLFPNDDGDPVSVPGFVSPKRVAFARSANALQTKSGGLFILPKKAMGGFVSPIKPDKSSVVNFVVGSTLSRDQVLEKLSLWNYEQVDHSHSPNTFSIRGGILDVFPLYEEKPVRVEFFGNHVESIRFFDPSAQLSSEDLSEYKLFSSANKNDNTIRLSDAIDELCDIVLYITNGSLVFLSGKKTMGVFVESFSVDLFSSSVKKKLIDDVLSRYPKNGVYLFNPLGRLFHRSNEAIELSLGLSRSFGLPSIGLACFSLSGGKSQAKNRSYSVVEKNKHEKITSLNSLSWGDFLVHVDFGIGVYRGLHAVGSQDNQEENLKIEYSGGDLVYVPINRFGRVHKYIGGGSSSPKLARLGSGAWEKQKAKTKKNAADVISHLVRLYNARSSPRGFRYTKENGLMKRLENSFPFQETKDQLLAIKEINADLDLPNPMDRLICGDVGFGKTEVAIRAAMRAVLSDKVVFFLAPTTVLSDQHYITCKNRLEPLGVTVELLSRFRTKKEQAIILDRLYNNKIDVLVGTHRLLNTDVPTKNLGLLVVDEEHRFGVKHKEYIRGIKNRVDVLTLTATPIPRTLQQSLVGIRDTTNIETPPLSRLPIQTSVIRFNWAFIKKAIQKELKRNGQVYFLHNDVAGLPFLFEKLGSFFPDARIAVGHGQLPSKQLEGVILSFFAGDVDILLCTTIIESGLDIPNANTIIINNAHMFGLAQLYQIRGRVGRGEKQAYCFLCLPADLQLLPDAFQRLKAIEHYSSLGSGYSIAIKDMEIRGAGNLFGYEQSGQISNVGFELYNKILNQALRESLGEKTSKQKDKLSVVFSGDALIKNEYMPLVQDRLYFYQKISEALSVDDIFSVREELVDRFGPLPIETETLLTISSLQCALYSYPILKIFIKPNVFSVVLGGVPAGLGPSAFFQRLSEAFQDSGRPYKIKNGGEGSLVIAFETVSIKDSLGFSFKFAELFSPVVDK